MLAKTQMRKTKYSSLSRGVVQGCTVNGAKDAWREPSKIIPGSGVASCKSMQNSYTIPIANGELIYWPQFLSSGEADDYFDLLQKKIVWHTPCIKLFGKEIDSPRMAAWYGDADAIYTYSGLTNQPLPWFDELSELKHRIEQQAQHRFNSVLANLYRDGGDSMGWHSDNEPELGLNPVIASLSLGDERKFVLRHNKHKTKKPIELNLEHGSLLVMAGETQHNWRHCIPKTRKQVTPRINLTFRLIKNTRN